jgi:uncharacterized protein (DUF58 family)
MRGKDIFTNVFNYLLALGLVLVFALFLSGRVGWFLVLVLVLAPIVSVAVTALLCHFVRVEGDVQAYTVNKGDSVNLLFKVINTSVLPLSPVVLEIADSPSAVCTDKAVSVSVMPHGCESFEVQCNAAIAGKGHIGIKSVKIRDYLGIVSFKLKKISPEGLCTEVYIIPDVADIPPDSDIISSAIEVAAHAVDSEDTTEMGRHSFGGFPGYDSREYVPGDPLKRINWKLSAKRSTLLIRLDDEALASPVSVVLDSIWNTAERNRTDEEALLLAQKTMETSLGIARSLSLSGCIVNYFARFENGWERYTVNSEGDIADISIALAGYSFGTDMEEDRVPFDEIASDKGAALVLCTPCGGEEATALEAACAERGISVVLYTADKGEGV